MAILAAELKLYKSSVINDSATNGGRLSANEITDNVKNNSFPDVTNTQRTAGITRYRKQFYKVANDADTDGTNAKICLDEITPGGSRSVIFQSAATPRDTQGDLTGLERLYGNGELNTDVSSSGTTLIVDAEAGDGADLIFQVADVLYITDGTNSEFVTVAAGGISWVTDQCTITIEAPGLVNAYASATPTTIAACIEQATITTSTDNYVETTTSGTFDEVTYPLINDHIGTVEQTWTLTFSDATNFTVSGDTIGSVGSGTIGGDFAPNNPDFTKPYFTLTSAGFGGTWANTETIVWQSHPATIDYWCKQIVPAGTAAIVVDSTRVFLSLESS